MRRQRILYSVLAIALTLLLGVIVNQAIAASKLQAIKQSGLTIVRLERPFRLKLNEVAQVETEPLKIKFLKVTQDSRCPTGAQCIWQGQAKIAVSLENVDRTPETVTLATSINGQEPQTRWNDYSLKLVEIQPYPTVKQKISTSDYTATLVISRRSASEHTGETSEPPGK